MRRTPHRLLTSLKVPLALFLGFAPSPAAGQAPGAGRAPMPLGIFVGSERERYLRVLQTLGIVPLYPWSIRGFSQVELDRLRPVGDAHPWAASRAFVAPVRPDGSQLGVLPAGFGVRYNTALPFGLNDGPVWAGRGLTAAAHGGGGARHGLVSIVVAPLMFWAQNQTFELVPTRQEGNLLFADPLYPFNVDRPQRFGDRAYMRFDLGQSTARLDAYGVAFGASTANQWWGPMTEYPFLLGTNAPGFTHFFFGSATPFNIWIGRLHARVVYGGLSQSAYTSVTGPAAKRFAASAIVVFSPRGVPGLELGIARFFHNVFPDSGIGARELRKPFETLFKLNLPDNREQGPENQLASLFARWVLPRGGFEVYGEFGREDHNGDSRDLLQEPDHASTYGLGLQKAWNARTGSIFVLRGELLNFEISTLARRRGEGGIYAHGDRGQGHTHRGQLLGSAVGVGTGSGATLQAERYTRNGSESVSWSRLVRLENDNASAATVRCTDFCLNVQHVLRAERFRTHARFDIWYRLGVVYDFNRNFRRDVINLNPEVELRWHP